MNGNQDDYNDFNDIFENIIFINSVYNKDFVMFSIIFYGGNVVVILIRKVILEGKVNFVVTIII